MSWFAQIWPAGTNQPVHWFFGGKGLGIQQRTSVWVGLSKSGRPRANQHVHRFFGDKDLGIQQGTSVWVGSPESISIW